MTKDTTKEVAFAAEASPFDDWFDTIEAGVLARVRGFNEGMPEGEMSGALSRPRNGRHRLVRSWRAPWSSRTEPEGHVRQDRTAAPRDATIREDGKTQE